MTKPHSERKHSKLSASGSERWFNCPGSVQLSEGLPDKDSVWSIEGTKAHEVLEILMNSSIHMSKVNLAQAGDKFRKVPREMFDHGSRAARFILDIHERTPGSEILVETRIHLKFIHPEMFGTFDGAVVDHFGTLHVFDYKYGAGVPVSPGTLDDPNLQMVFYGIGLAHQFDWNFKRVRLWIIQPRIKSYEGPLFLELRLSELKAFVPRFREAVDRVLKSPNDFKEGGWCHWCKAKSICPLKAEAKLEKAKSIFSISPIEEKESWEF